MFVSASVSFFSSSPAVFCCCHLSKLRRSILLLLLLLLLLKTCVCLTRTFCDVADHRSVFSSTLFQSHQTKYSHHVFRNEMKGGDRTSVQVSLCSALILDGMSGRPCLLTSPPDETLWAHVRLTEYLQGLWQRMRDCEKPPNGNKCPMRPQAANSGGCGVVEYTHRAEPPAPPSDSPAGNTFTT